MSKLRQAFYRMTSSPQKLGEMLTCEAHNEMPDIQKIKDLIASGASLSIPSRSGETPLTSAARYGHTAIIEALLKAGVSPDERDKSNYTALMSAANNGRIKVIDQLIAAGANMELTGGVLGGTALDYALMWFEMKQGIETTHHLLSKGAALTLKLRICSRKNIELQPMVQTIIAERKKKRLEIHIANERKAADKRQKHEDWLDAGMPLTKPLKIKNKPLTQNKKPGE